MQDQRKTAFVSVTADLIRKVLQWEAVKFMVMGSSPKLWFSLESLDFVSLHCRSWSAALLDKSGVTEKAASGAGSRDACVRFSSGQPCTAMPQTALCSMPLCQQEWWGPSAAHPTVCQGPSQTKPHVRGVGHTDCCGWCRGAGSVHHRASLLQAGEPQ